MTEETFKEVFSQFFENYWDAFHEALEAHQLFAQIYDSLLLQGHKFIATKKEILKRTRHGTPREPLQVDAAR